MNAKDWRVIYDYSTHYRLKPQLSTPSIGQFVFLNEAGEQVKVGMQQMKKDVEELRKKDKHA